MAMAMATPTVTATLSSLSPLTSDRWSWRSHHNVSLSGRFRIGSHHQIQVDGFKDRQIQRRTLSSVPRASSATASPSAAANGSSPLISEVVWPASGAFLAMAAMSVLDKLIEPMGLTFTIAPFGAVCAVLFSAPQTPAAKKYNMFLAHTGCAAIGVAALFLFGPGWLARSTSLAASLAFMQLTKSLHPPAAGLPLLFIDVPKFQQLQWWYIIFPSAVGCILLCLLQELVLYLRKNWRF